MSEPLLSALAETPWLAVQGSALLLLLTLPAAPRDALTLVRPVALGLLLAGLAGRALAALGLGAQASAAVVLPLLAGLSAALALRPAEPSGPTAPLRPLILLSPALLLWAFAGAEPATPWGPLLALPLLLGASLPLFSALFARLEGGARPSLAPRLWALAILTLALQGVSG
ncbi:MAG: hypothetical protein VYC93_00905 [Pseudomonadota bacterium]|nr:hypothetical protein [Pseudomonadota bacterium]